METCKLTRHGCNYAPFNPTSEECDTRAIKPEKYAELREQDFDTWLDTILHEIIEQVNFDASEVNALGGAVWNGEYPDGTPYPKQCSTRCYYCDTDSLLLDTHAIKPEKYAELREQDFDTWLGTILHEIIEQGNFNAREVDALGGAVWNGEYPDGTPYPKQCAREDAYIQCIRQSNQLDAHNAKLELLDDRIDALKDLFEDLEAQINDLSIRFDEFKKFVGYTLADPAVSPHTGSNFCGNCSHYQAPTSSITLPICNLSGEIVDPDDSSCAMFEPPF